LKGKFMTRKNIFLSLVQRIVVTLTMGSALTIGMAFSHDAYAQVDPVVINLQAGSTQTQHAFGRSAAGEVIHYYWSPVQGWQAENLTSYSNIGTAFRIVQDLKVINGPTSDSGAPVQHVFGRNGAGDLIHYYWISSQGWAAENLTRYSNIGTGFRIYDDPVVINLQSGSTPTQHAFACNRDDDVIHYYWSPAQGWQAENLTSYSNIGANFRITNGLKVINGPTSDSGALVQHLFGRNAVGDLIHYYWISSQGWAAENLTTGYSNIGTAFRIFGN
jgi:hypothetical protein